jgi:hypothetical protein
MKEFRRVPTRSEAFVAALAGLVLALVFGLFASVSWQAKPPEIIPALVLSALAILCAVIFFRAAFSRRRALSGAAARKLGMAYLVVGVAGSGAAILFGTGHSRWLLLGPSLSCIAYGAMELGAKDEA